MTRVHGYFALLIVHHPAVPLVHLTPGDPFIAKKTRRIQIHNLGRTDPHPYTTSFGVALLRCFSFVLAIRGWRPLSLKTQTHQRLALKNSCKLAHLTKCPSFLPSPCPHFVLWTRFSTSPFCFLKTREPKYYRQKTLIFLQTNPSISPLTLKGRGSATHTLSASSPSLSLPVPFW